MHDTIQADYEALENVGNRFGQQEQTVAQLLQRVLSVMEKLQGGGWIGRGSQAFFAEMENEVGPGVRRLGAALSQASRTTHQIAQLLQEADEQAGAPFQGNGFGSGSGIGAIGGFSGIGGYPSNLGGVLGSSLPINMGEGSNQSGGSWGSGSYNPLGGHNTIFDQVLEQNGFGASGDWGQTDQLGLGEGGLGSGNDWGIPQDWLSGVTNAIFGDQLSEGNNFGIPSNWLEEIQQLLGLENGSGMGESGNEALGESGSGGEGVTGGSGGAMGGATDMGEIGSTSTDAPVGSEPGLSSETSGLSPDGMSEAGDESLPKSTGFGESGGSGSGLGPSTGDGTIGGGANSGMAAGSERMQAPVTPIGNDNQSSNNVRPEPMRYHPMSNAAVGVIGGAQGSGISNYPSSMGRASTIPQHAASGAGGNLGIPVGLAALTPFAALLGKVLSEKKDKSEG